MALITENGWPQVGADQCTWSTVPGTSVSIQLRSGVPTTILVAFAARFNELIEPLRDADTAGWTPTNAVWNSNHLSGTAMDLNWNTHPFHATNDNFTFGDRLPALRALLDEFRGCVWWGGDWQSPVDSMHFQLNYGEGDQRLIDLAAELAPVSPADGYARAIIAEGQRRQITPRGIQIALATALVESNLRMYANASVPESMSIPHDAVGSDHDSLGLFQQRCPMWGDAATLMNPTLSSGLFYDHLANLDYNNTDETPGYWAQAVQRSAFPDRYDERFGDAVALYDRLAATSPPTTGVFMALTDAEQRELLELARQMAGYRRVSRSPLRHVGEGETETVAGFELNVDGSVHVLLVQALARLGDPDAVNLLTEVAHLDPSRYPDRAHDRLLAQAILNDIAAKATVGTAAPVGQTPGVVEVETRPTPIAATPVTPTYAPTMPVTVTPPPLTTGGLLADLADLASTVRRTNDAVRVITEGNPQ